MRADELTPGTRVIFDPGGIRTVSAVDTRVRVLFVEDGDAPSMFYPAEEVELAPATLEERIAALIAEGDPVDPADLQAALDES